MKFDSQGRLISPSGAPAVLGSPIAVTPTEDVGDDDLDMDEEEGGVQA